MPEKTLHQQAEKMDRLTKDLMRKFQMRDRNEISCCGVTVSQCYTLDMLGEHGEMSMVQLARKMFLDKSTMTRVVDGLVERELVVRRFVDSDRRLIYVALTLKGRKLLEGIRAQQLHSLRQILERIPAGERQKLLDGLEIFAAAVHDWLMTCCAPANKEKEPIKIKSQKFVQRIKAANG
jgi:DNA-binding MarR family transcriptional regulator